MGPRFRVSRLQALSRAFVHPFVLRPRHPSRRCGRQQHGRERRPRSRRLDPLPGCSFLPPSSPISRPSVPLEASLHRSPSHLGAPPPPVRPPPVVTRRPPPVSAWPCARASSGPGRAGLGWRARLRAPSPPELAVGGAGVRRSVHLAPPVLGLYRAGAVAVRGGLAGRIVVSMVSASEWPVG